MRRYRELWREDPEAYAARMAQLIREINDLETGRAEEPPPNEGDKKPRKERRKGEPRNRGDACSETVETIFETPPKGRGRQGLGAVKNSRRPKHTQKPFHTN